MHTCIQRKGYTWANIDVRGISDYFHEQSLFMRNHCINARSKEEYKLSVALSNVFNLSDGSSGFKVAMSPLRRMFFKLCKTLHRVTSITIRYKKLGSPSPFLSYKSDFL